MFLRPLHFQASNRYVADLARRNESWDVHYNWGLRSLELDPMALQNYQVVVRSLEARLRDGTTVAIPRDGSIAPLDLRPAMREKRLPQVDVYLALPALNPGRANAAVKRDARLRYFQESVTLEDENAGGNPQLIVLRGVSHQLLAGEQNHAGYEVLPIARIEKSDQAGGLLQLNAAYIPPLLSCDAWKPLNDGLVGGLLDRIGKKIEWLSDHIAAQGITLDRQLPGDLLLFKQLQQMCEASTVLGVLTTARGVHPIDAFLELSRIAGQMSIFDATRRAPDLPHYDHDDLGACFARLKQIIDGQLNRIMEPEYEERPFVGAGWRMQVGLEKTSWLESTSQVFIGVQSTLEAGQCVSLLTEPGQLDMKIGSSDRVESLFRQGAPGLRFAAEQLPPQELPKIAGQIYFKVAHDPKDPEWGHVKKTLTLALRLNENLIVGSIQNQRRLTINVGGRHVGMQFSLFVLTKKG
jgi:type VI secretion system protein ImpJ